ncbi:MAG: glutathione peroxidase [Bacteroidota bacterium]
MATTTSKSIHQFTVNNVKGEPVSLSDYEGKVLMIVNTASKCGFTPQLDGLEELYKEFREEGFEILAFPSNDFAGQEPLDGQAIQEFCTLNYQSSFPIFDKVHVKGKKVHPLYRFLSSKSENGQVSSSPRWNFHKYLVDKEGKVIDYFYTFTNPTAGKVKKAIKKLLKG